MNIFWTQSTPYQFEYLSKALALFSLLTIVYPQISNAQNYLQEVTGYTTVDANGSYQDFTIPENPALDHIEFVLKGADGGKYQREENCRGDGGEGARVRVVFPIGIGFYKLSPGGTIRIIAGKKGSNQIHHAHDGDPADAGGGGGGGGTAILYLNPTVDPNQIAATPYTDLGFQFSGWVILGVAGGGGGAHGMYITDHLGNDCKTTTGTGGQTGTAGSHAGFNIGGTGGEGGRTGISGDKDGGAGGGYLSDGNLSATAATDGKKGGLTGGDGGTKQNGVAGGFGYGGGGAGVNGKNGGAGGGGGYSGGAGGDSDETNNNNSGGGGGSFANSASDAGSRLKEYLGNTGNPRDGYVEYIFRSAGPAARCKDISVSLVSGSYTLTPDEVDDNSTVDFGNSALYFLEKIFIPGAGNVDIPKSTLTFDCDDVGTRTRTLVVSNENEETDQCTFQVTIQDPPTVVCKDVFGGIVLSVSQDQDATLSVADLYQSSSDFCGTVVNKYLSQEVFSCADVGVVDQVTLTVEDDDGNTGSCSVNIGFAPVFPRITCPPAVTVDARVDVCLEYGIQLDLEPTILDASCEGSEIVQAYSSSITPQSAPNPDPTWERGPFLPVNNTEFPVGVTTLRYELLDNGAIISQCTTTITVEDHTAPFLTCPTDITIDLPPGECQASISNNLTPHRMTDNCGATLSWSGVYLNESGPPYTDLGSGEGVIPALSLGLGVSEFQYQLEDAVGNSTDCSFSITVNGASDFEAICKNITVALDANGQASITPAEVDDGSFDDCGPVSLSLSRTDLDCSQLGANQIVLTAENNNGQQASCEATITIIDDLAPTITCPPSLTVTADAASCSATITEGFLPPYSDNCTIDFFAYALASGDDIIAAYNDVDQIPDELTLEAGSYQATLLVTDQAMLTAQCDFTITVEDHTPPVVGCQSQPIVVDLDENGQASITPGQIATSALDACGSVTRSLSQADFDCSDLGDHEVVLTVTDVAGNTASCTATVTIVDDTPPQISCAPDLIVATDPGSCAATITEGILPTYSDNCSVMPAGAAILHQTVDELFKNFPTQLILQKGWYRIRFTVTDGNNTASCVWEVTVEDQEAPTVNCQDLTVYLEDDGQLSFDPATLYVDASDNCGLAPDQSVTAGENYGCSDLGSHEFTFSRTDNSGNTGSCTSAVTVLDNTAPMAICQNITVQLDAQGVAVIAENAVDDGSNDACLPTLGGGLTFDTDLTSFDCGNVGSNPVTLTVTDANGNSKTCPATVTVEDKVAPTAICQNITVQLDDQGNATITGSDIDGGSSDACGVESRIAIRETFGCADVGANSVTLTVTDVNGNTSTCTATVTIEDNIAPSLACTNRTVTFNGQSSFAVNQLDLFTTDDACGIAETSFSVTSLSCDRAGEVVPVTVSAWDVNGNLATCTANVTVLGLPCGFYTADIGCSSQTDYNAASGVFTIQTNNCNSTNPASDEQGTIAYRLCGNGSISFHVASLSSQNAFAGIQLRTGPETSAVKAEVVTNLYFTARGAVREYAGASAWPLPFYLTGRHWLKLERWGNQIRIYTSANGQTWSILMVRNLTLPNCVYVGMMAYGPGAVTATFDDVKVNGSPLQTGPLQTGGGGFPLEEASPKPSTVGRLPSTEAPLPSPRRGETGLTLAVYPNPTTGQLTVELPAELSLEGATLEVVDAYGRSVLRETTLDYQQRLDLSRLPAGAYFARLRTAAGEWLMERIIVED